MIDRLATDLAAAHERLGVPVTLGAVSTYGVVSAADDELLRAAGSPVALLGRAILVIVRTPLAGLKPGATVTVNSVAHLVDRVLRSDGIATTRFLAYPS
jgi:hypothetical protein